MASSPYRITTGLQIDGLSEICTGVGAPSGVNANAAFHNAAPLGTIYMESDTAANNLNTWVKWKNTTNTVADWVQMASTTYVQDALIGAGVSSLTAGPGISVSSSTGAVTISNTGVTSIIAGTNTYVSGSGAITINGPKLYAEAPSSPTLPSAAGTNSVALGFAATAGAAKSLAIGEQSLTRIQGGVVQASGRFASAGDAQVGRYLLRTVTVTNVPTEMFVDGVGGSVRLVLPDDATWTFTAVVTGHRTDAADGHAGFELKGVIYRVAGATSVVMQGTKNTTTIARSNTPWTASVSADTVNGSLKLTVTGENSKTIRWVALVEVVEVTN
jgi:hypothetical protein